MRQLTPEGRTIVEDLARRHGFSTGAVTTMLMAVAAAGGGMAQFDHPEFGGMGQWSQGGMTMIGDMFNNALKARVDGLCSELAGLLARQPLTAQPRGGQSQSQSQGGFAGGFFRGGEEVSLFVPITGRSSAGWWPADLGQPSSTGQQNDIRYAVFPAARRLAIDIAGRLTVYDTLDHQIGGISQQQSGDASLSFTSQDGLVRLSELPIVAGDTRAPSPPPPAAAPATPPPPARPGRESSAAASTPAPPPAVSPPPPAPAAPPPHPVPAAESADEIFAKIERLADLRGKGILSEDEFATKKAELLARL